MDNALAWIAVVFGTAASLLLVPALVLAFQSLLAARPLRPSSPPPGPRPRVAVLMPAHDEAEGIAAALASVRPQLREGDRLLVVADNCSDDTALVARACGAEVVERSHATLRGKGHALAFGARALRADPPGVLLVLDADCTLHPGALDRLARRCAASGRPVQALYLMEAPRAGGLKSRIATFAWIVKNLVRPLGFLRAGLPCQLMGTGMAFAWAGLPDDAFASGHLVEDMELGLALAQRGSAPLFCPHALVTSRFPSDAGGTATQRRRWEQGHLAMIARAAPALLPALLRGRGLLAALLLDMLVPPLAVLVLAVVASACAGALLAAIGGSAVPFGLSLAALSLVTVAVGVAWAAHGRAVVSLRDLCAVPLYVAAKLPMYIDVLRRRPTAWVRTKRDDQAN